MKFLLFLFLIVALGIFIGVMIDTNPGYTVISFNNWVVSTNIWTALACLLLFFIVFYALTRLMHNIFAFPTYLARKRKLAQAHRYQLHMEKGMMGLAAGDFKRAEKHFIKVNNQHESCATYLLAAQAAQAQHEFVKRDEYFQKAFDIAGEDRFAVLLTQANYLMQNDQTDEALLIFKQLHRQKPTNPLVLRGLKNIYFQLHQWEPLHLILPQLKKLKLITEDELEKCQSGR